MIVFPPPVPLQWALERSGSPLITPTTDPVTYTGGFLAFRKGKAH